MLHSLSVVQKIKFSSNQFDWPKFIYVGDCGVDLIGEKVRPGGCALNVSYYLHKLKQNIDVLTWVGNDDGSKVVINTLNDIGADEIGIHQISGQTPAQLISIQPGGEKKFESYEPGVLASVKLTEADQDFINQHQILITLCYSQIVDLFEQVTHLEFDGLKVVDFMSLADFNFDLNFVKKYVNWFDIALFGLNENQTDLIDQIKTMSKEYQKLSIVTLGSAGSKVFWGEQEYFQPTTATKVVDTTGCGDAFLAGFLSEFAQSQNIEQSMKSGSNLAAQVSTYVGAIPEK